MYLYYLPLFLHLLYNFVKELPSPILDDVAVHRPVEQPRLSCEPQDSLDAMKIAWRYQNLPKVQVIGLYFMLPVTLMEAGMKICNKIYLIKW